MSNGKNGQAIRHTPVDLERARAVLRTEGYTCVFCLEDRMWVSRQRGVKPLLEQVYSNQSFRGFCVADKVVGKAAAFLYLLLEIRALYADVLSIPAKELLESHGVTVEYGSLVAAINNRTGDGFCPMEQAVWNISDPQTALTAIEKRLQELTKG